MSHRRGFLTVGDRQLHYRHAGSGPAIILLHAAPKSSLEQVPLLERLSSKFSAYAFDIPGYGDSEPLATPHLEVSDMATDLAAALDALGIETCSIYGRHTGGLIALEFGRLFPGRLVSAIFDGFPVFAEDERRRLLNAYLQPLMPYWDGLHLPGLWARMRENYLYFPWSDGPIPGNRNDLSMPPATQLHSTAVDMLKVMDGWRVVYASSFRYRPHAAVAGIDYPSMIMARRDDLLYKHLERLPSLPASLTVESQTYDVEAWATRIETFFIAHPSTRDAPTPHATVPIAARSWSSILQLDDASIRLRQWGSGKAEAIILHDVPGNSSLELPLLSGIGRVLSSAIAPDLPGTGLSSMTSGDAAKLVGILAQVAARCLTDAPTVVARGLSASLGMALAQRIGARRLVLIRPLFAPDESASFAQSYVAASAPDDEGTYLTKLWYAARDNELYWPWYDRTRLARRLGERRLDPAYLTSKVMAMAENLQGYAALVGMTETLQGATVDAPELQSHILVDGDEIGQEMAAKASLRLANRSTQIVVEQRDEAEVEAVIGYLTQATRD